MSIELDRAATNHTTTRVKKSEPVPARISFLKLSNGHTDVSILNASRLYSRKELDSFGEMLQVLQSEGKVGASGSLLVAQLEAM